MGLISTHVEFASPYLQDNQTFLFHTTLYQVDKRLIQIADGIFKYLIPIDHSWLGFRSMIKLTVPGLSENLLNYILQFFQYGKFQNTSIELKNLDELTFISGQYSLHLLNRYVEAIDKVKGEGETLKSNIQIHLDDDFIRKIEENLAFSDQLELSALQQNPQNFYRLFYSLVKEPLVSDPHLNCIAHFNPQTFEKLIVQWIDKEHPQDTEVLIKTYCKERQRFIDNIIYSIKNQKIRFQCIAAIDHLDRRIKWLKTFEKDLPMDLIRKAIINPLMQQNRLAEAKDWTLRTQFPSLPFATNLAGNVIEAKNISMEEDFVAPALLLSMLSFSLSPQPTMHFTDVMQIVVNQYLNEIKKSRTLSHRENGCLIKNLKSKLVEAHLDVELNSQRIFEMVQYVIQSILQYYIDDTLLNLQRAKVPIKYYEKHLHPALQENYELICELVPFIQQILKLEFATLSNQQLLGKHLVILNYDYLLCEVVKTARDLYCQHFSRQEDFIIQFISHAFAPYVNGRYSHEHLEKQPCLLYELINALKDMQLESELKEPQIELAISIYNQKVIETINFYFCNTFSSKLNINNTKDWHVKKILRFLSITRKALLKHFPLEEIEKMAPKMVNILDKEAYFQRELFIKALQAFYRIFSPKDNPPCPQK